MESARTGWNVTSFTRILGSSEDFYLFYPLICTGRCYKKGKKPKYKRKTKGGIHRFLSLSIYRLTAIQLPFQIQYCLFSFLATQIHCWRSPAFRRLSCASEAKYTLVRCSLFSGSGRCGRKNTRMSADLVAADGGWRPRIHRDINGWELKLKEIAVINHFMQKFAKKNFTHFGKWDISSKLVIKPRVWRCRLKLVMIYWCIYAFSFLHFLGFSHTLVVNNCIPENSCTTMLAGKDVLTMYIGQLRATDYNSCPIDRQLWKEGPWKIS